MREGEEDTGGNGSYRIQEGRGGENKKEGEEDQWNKIESIPA